MFSHRFSFAPRCGELATSQIESTTDSRKPDSVDHIFANNVRFLSMAAIIAVHTILSYPAVAQIPSPPSVLLYLAQPLKFGTIAFFLVAGFLFGERINAWSPLEYFKRRLQNVFVPWLFWFSLFCMLALGSDAIHERFGWAILPQAFLRCRNLLLDSAFWFVPNLLFALALLLIFRRILTDVRMGFAFLLLSLFYGVNIYGHWMPVHHTRAILGFVFYLWLGAWGAWHFPALEKLLARVPAIAMLGLIFLTLTLALAETKLLHALGSIDPINTLRISNQIYSVVVVLGIVKVRRSLWPRFVDVRKHTFGLYLTHTLGLAMLVRVLKRLLPYCFSFTGRSQTVVGVLLILVMFCLTYAGCLLAVKALLSDPRLRWAIGLSAQGKARTGRTLELKVKKTRQFLPALNDVPRNGMY
jgi:hypothetical protein